LNEKQYRDIISITDDVIMGSDLKSAVAIPWLHVIRAHPVFLKNYETLFEDHLIANYHSFLRLISNDGLVKSVIT
jgi:hypothetical protein